MKIIHLQANEAIPFSNLSLCLGFFDGMHIAHQKLFNATILQNKPTAVMTFSTHIPSFMHNEQYFALTIMADKIEIAKKYGFDYFIILEVTKELVTMEPDKFIRQYLFSCAKVIVGFDFRFGHLGKGDASYLHSLLPDKTIIIPEMDYYNKKVGSTRIRKQLSLGKLSLANRLLGRKYQINGVVVKGYGRGKTLGYPTANVDYDGYYLPKHGVYYTTIRLHDKIYDAMTYIGAKPTFNDRKVALETYIFGFEKELYSEVITIYFEAYIRPDMAFSNKEMLIAQINKDELSVQKLISSRRKL